MEDKDPGNSRNTIADPSSEGSRLLGYSALTGMMDLDVDEIISGMELMLIIQEDLPYIEVKEEQVECLDAIQEARVEGADKALFQMATGLGKTTVAAADVRRFLKENPSARVLVLSHQNRISDQLRERFEQILGSDYTYSNFTGEDPEGANTTCVFASFQSMAGWREAFHEDEFDYVLVDEAHHAKATTYEPTLQYFKPKFMLAMTATPDRHDMRNIREIFGQEVYKLTLEEAIARNLLAYVDYHVLYDEIAAATLLRDPETRKKLSVKQLNRKIFMPMRDKEIARLCVEKEADLENDVHRLVFCKSIEQTEELAQYFNKAAPIHTNLPAWEIKQTLEKFKSGEIETLLTVDMFNEGIDVPKVNQVVFMRLTDSVTVFLQQLGRGLRKLEGKDKVQVLDFVANCDRLAVLEAFWRRVAAAVEVSEGETKDVLRINGGEFHFTDTTRNILELLSDIESNKNQFKTWEPNDSINYYQKLCDGIGRLATVEDIKKASLSGKGPSYNLLVRDYEGSLNNLRIACDLGIEVAPKGVLSVAEFARKHHTTPSKVIDMVDEIGFELPTYLFLNVIASGLSIEQQAAVLDTPFFRDLPPEGYESINSFSKIAGVTEKTARKLAAELDHELPLFRFGQLMAEGLSPEDQAELLKRPSVELQTAGEEDVSTRKLREKLRVSAKTLNRAISILEIKPRTRKFGPKPGQALTTTEAARVTEAIESSRVPQAPPEAVSLPVFAKTLGIAPKSLRGIVTRVKLDLPTYKFGVPPAEAILPEHWDAIFSDSSLNTSKKPLRT